METQLLSTLLRGGDRLTRYVVDVRKVVEASESWGQEGTAAVEARDGLASFSELGAEASFEERRVLAAWERLGRVGELNAQLMDDIQAVLEETIVHPHADQPSLAPLKTEAPPAPPKATAAHPRAYQGTKKRPPKPSRGTPMDLRPFLLTRMGCERLMERFRERGLGDEAREVLDGAFPEPEAPASL
ncbi:MAG: hypothetical protein AAGG01_21585, partial [Planctomycetota bacterium]